MFRHADLMELRDETEEDPMELEASKYDLAYIKLDGNIGCMVNGAGLAMATMDIIKLNGVIPAKSLDGGGRGTKEREAKKREGKAGARTMRPTGNTTNKKKKNT